MLVIPQIAFRAELVAIGEALPPVRHARELAGRGATEISLLDLDGALASDQLPQWAEAIVAIAGVPVRFDGRLHEGSRIERIARAGFQTVVVDQSALFDAALLRWALDLFGSRLCVEVQVDGEYIFDPPDTAFGRELVDVLSNLHMQGARRVLYRDITGDTIPTSAILDLVNRCPGMQFTYQGPVRSIADISLLTELGAAVEGVLISSDLITNEIVDLGAANAAAAPRDP